MDQEIQNTNIPIKYPTDILYIIYQFLKSEEIVDFINNNSNNKYIEKILVSKKFWLQYFLAIYDETITISQLSNISYLNSLLKIKFLVNTEYGNNTDLIYPLIYLGADINVHHRPSQEPQFMIAEKYRSRIARHTNTKMITLLDFAENANNKILINFLVQKWKFLRSSEEKCKVITYDSGDVLNDDGYIDKVEIIKWAKNDGIELKHGDILRTDDNDSRYTYAYNQLDNSCENCGIILSKIISRYIQNPDKFYFRLEKCSIVGVCIDTNIHPKLDELLRFY